MNSIKLVRKDRIVKQDRTCRTKDLLDKREGHSEAMVQSTGSQVSDRSSDYW